MDSWRGTVLIGLVIAIVVVAARGNADDAAEAADATSSPVPSTSASPARPQPPDTGAEETAGVMVTFDDGPHPDYTPEILDTLRDHEVTAVFCVVGEQAEKYPLIIQRIVNEGHVLCNHTYDHDGSLDSRSAAEIEQNLSRTRDAIDEAVPGVAVPYFRQPFMHVTERVAAVSEPMGYEPLNWTIDTRDWSKPGADAIVSAVTDRLQPGSVILMHDGGGDRTGTVEALPLILTAIKDADLSIVHD